MQPMLGLTEDLGTTVVDYLGSELNYRNYSHISKCQLFHPGQILVNNPS